MVKLLSTHYSKSIFMFIVLAKYLTKRFYAPKFKDFTIFYFIFRIVIFWLHEFVFFFSSVWLVIATGKII